MSTFDFTDRTAQFAAEGVGGSVLADGSGNGNFIDDNLGVPGGFTGHVASDGGRARGTIDSGFRHFQRGTGPATPWDLRTTGTPGGLISVTWTGWVRLTNAEQGYFVSIHDVASASSQAYRLLPRSLALGGMPSPFFSMADGLSLFNFRSVKATLLDTIPLNTWQFVAGGWNKDTNKIFCFWGKAPGVHYYDEAAGFAAGFQYTSNVANLVKVGFWNNEAGVASMYIDHMLYWKGRALSELELRAVWDNHVGIDFSQLTGTLPNGDDAALAAQSYYYGRP